MPLKKQTISKSSVVDQLVIGTREEFEHTDNILAAMKIAVDHLIEDPLYYDKLAEAGLISKDSLAEWIGRK